MMPGPPRHLPLRVSLRKGPRTTSRALPKPRLRSVGLRLSARLNSLLIPLSPQTTMLHPRARPWDTAPPRPRRVPSWHLQSALASLPALALLRRLGRSKHIHMASTWLCPCRFLPTRLLPLVSLPFLDGFRHHMACRCRYHPARLLPRVLLSVLALVQFLGRFRHLRMARATSVPIKSRIRCLLHQTGISSPKSNVSINNSSQSASSVTRQRHEFDSFATNLKRRRNSGTLE